MPPAAIPTVLHDWKHATAAEAKKEIFEAIGDISKIEIFGAQVLVVPYVRPEKTPGGIITTGSAKEDIWQGKVALVVKVGPTAFHYTDENKERALLSFGGRFPEVGDWVFHDVKACFMLHVRGTGAKTGRDGRLVYAAELFGRLQDLTPVV